MHDYLPQLIKLLIQYSNNYIDKENRKCIGIMDLKGLMKKIPNQTKKDQILD